VALGRDSGGLGGGIVALGRDSGGLGGGIVASRRDAGGLGGIVASGRDSSGAGGSIEGSGRDLGGLGGRIEGSRRVSGFAGGIARLLDRTLGSNGCKAFLLPFDRRARQGMQVEKTLLPGLAKALARKEESGSFWMQAEQYLESISDVKERTRLYSYKRVREGNKAHGQCIR
jgi:hypothetical protein